MTMKCRSHHVTATNILTQQVLSSSMYPSNQCRQSPRRRTEFVPLHLFQYHLCLSPSSFRYHGFEKDVISITIRFHSILRHPLKHFERPTCPSNLFLGISTFPQDDIVRDSVGPDSIPFHPLDCLPGISIPSTSEIPSNQRGPCLDGDLHIGPLHSS